MKFCLNYTVGKEYLKKADEIKIRYMDRKIVDTVAEQYPDKTIVLNHSIDDDPIDWEEMATSNILTKGKLILCLRSLDDCYEAKDREINFYYGFPVSSWDEAQALKQLGVCYLRVAAPLFFCMPELKALDVPIRAVPNIAYEEYLLHENGVLGTWIRPEDIKYYDKYVAMCEFEDCDSRKEQALYRIYAEEQMWPGDLNMLISNLNYAGDNMLILSEFSKRRLNCTQSCMRPYGSCHMCYRMFDLAQQEEAIRQYGEKMKQNTDD